MNTVTSSSGSHGRTCKRCGAPYRLWSWQRAMGSGLCVTCTKAEKKPLQKPIWEREITSREDALKAVKVAAFCYFGLALLDFIIARFGEPSLDVTAAVIAVCAPLIWLCHSRAAAVVLLGLFVFDVIVGFITQINAPKGNAPFVSFPLLEPVELKGCWFGGVVQVAGMSYPSDLSDEQWAKIEPFFGRPDPRGAREKYPKRRVVEACLYRLREGCRWRALPHDFPPYDTVFDHWQRWQERGVWQEAVAVLGTRWREVALGRGRRAPRHAILDSQSIKTAAEGEERGFHGGKKIKGR